MSPSAPENASKAPYLSTTEFVTRLQWYTQTVVLRQPSDFRDVVLTQGKALQKYPRITAAQKSIAGLLKGKTRLLAVNTGHAVNLSPKNASVRHVVQAANGEVQKCVSVAHAALQSAAALDPLTYIVEVEYEENFAGVVRHQVCSPRYLDWVVAVRALGYRDQRAIRDYCEAETQWGWQTDGKVAYPGSSSSEPTDAELAELRVNAEHELSQQRQNMSAAAQTLILEREAPMKGEWHWLQPWAKGTVAWPFPGALDGNEDQDTLRTEAKYWEAMGRSLSWLPFDSFIHSQEPTAASEALLRKAIDAWAACLEAGMALCYLAGVLRACIQPLSNKICDRCFRHVGADERRRCNVHHTRSSERGKALRLDELAAQYHARLAQLRRELSHETVYCHPVEQLSTCWQPHPGMQDPYIGRRNPIYDGKWPTQPPAESAKRLASGLHRMIERLAPVVGPVLHERLTKLALSVQADADRVIGSTHAAPQSTQQRGSPQAASKIDEVLHRLTPPGFFGVWFSEAESQEADPMSLVGNDPAHPLVQLPAKPKRRARRSERTRTATAASNAFGIAAVVLDLVRHRAWIEAGGEVSDALIRAGKPLPDSKSRVRIDVPQAYRLLQEGMSYRKIGEIFGVSGPAVFKALAKFDTDNVPLTRNESD